MDLYGPIVLPCPLCSHGGSSCSAVSGHLAMLCPAKPVTCSLGRMQVWVAAPEPATPQQLPEPLALAPQTGKR